MSTQEIGELIDSVNDLTQTVAGKMSEIDQKVDEATASVPDTLRSMSEVTYYIDAVLGNDSNSGTSKTAPLKTAKGASDKAAPNSIVVLQFKGGQDHFVNFTTRGCVVTCIGWDTVTDDLATYPRLHCGNYFSVDSEKMAAIGFNGQQSSITMTRVIVRLLFNQTELNGKVIDPNRSSFTGFADSNLVMFSYKSKIELHDIHLSTVWTGYGLRDFHMSATEVERLGDESGKILKDRNGQIGTIRLGLHAITLTNCPGGWEDLIPTNAGRDNIFSNITI